MRKATLAITAVCQSVSHWLFVTSCLHIIWLDLIQCKTSENGWIIQLKTTKKHFYSQPEDFQPCSVHLNQLRHHLHLATDILEFWLRRSSVSWSDWLIVSCGLGNLRRTPVLRKFVEMRMDCFLLCGISFDRRHLLVRIINTVSSFSLTTQPDSESSKLPPSPVA